MTFSIIGRCAETGQIGIAVASSFMAVAARCAFVRAGVGAVAIQSMADPRLGPGALDLSPIVAVIVLMIVGTIIVSLILA